MGAYSGICAVYHAGFHVRHGHLVLFIPGGIFKAVGRIIWLKRL